MEETPPDLEAAARVFEPGSYADPSHARAVAQDLYEEFFLKTARISVSGLPAEVEGDRYVLRTGPREAPERYALVFVRVGEREGFRLARETLASLDDWIVELASAGYDTGAIGSLSTLGRLHYRLEASLPQSLLSIGFLIENWKWLGLLLLLFVAVILDRVVRFLVQRVVQRLAGRGAVSLDQEMLASFERPTGLLAGALAFQWLLPLLRIDAGVLSILVLATSLVAAVAGVWACYRLVDVVCDYMGERAAGTSSRFDDMLVPLLRRTLRLFVVAVGLVFVASHLSDDLWSVVAGLGLGSIAVGFAARDSIENLFGTFTVLLDKPFQIGDWVQVGSLEGTVEQVGFRSTRIRTFYDSLITVPNREFISSAVDNLGERRYRRIKTMLSVTYDTPPEKIEAFCEGIRELIRHHPYTRKDVYHVYLNSFGPSSLDVLLYAFLATPDWATELREKHRLFADILRLAEKLGVGFAFPTSTIHVAKPEDLEHPDRPASDDEGAERGRRLGAEVARHTLRPFGGEKPAPVQTLRSPVYGEEGADGG